MNTPDGVKEFVFQQITSHDGTLLNMYLNLYHPIVRSFEAKRITSVYQLLTMRIIGSVFLFLICHLTLYFYIYGFMTSCFDVLTPWIDQLQWTDSYASSILFGSLVVSYLLPVGEKILPSIRWPYITQLNQTILYLAGGRFFLIRMPFLLSVAFIRKSLPYTINLFPLINHIIIYLNNFYYKWIHHLQIVLTITL